jgi:ribonuclease T1
MSSVNPTRTSSSRVLAVGLVVLSVLAVLWYAGHRGTTGLTQGTVATSSTTGQSASGSDHPTPDSGLPTIAAADLPSAAQNMLVTIHAGGPFRYTEDGQTFANRERILPRQDSAYYKEYTVKAGIQGDRGPLRIIGGHLGDLYWTSDHYAHFQQIKEGNR